MDIDEAPENNWKDFSDENLDIIHEPIKEEIATFGVGI